MSDTSAYTARRYGPITNRRYVSNELELNPRGEERADSRRTTCRSCWPHRRNDPSPGSDRRTHPKPVYSTPVYRRICIHLMPIPSSSATASCTRKATGSADAWRPAGRKYRGPARRPGDRRGARTPPDATADPDAGVGGRGGDRRRRRDHRDFVVTGPLPDERNEDKKRIREKRPGRRADDPKRDKAGGRRRIEEFVGVLHVLGVVLIDPHVRSGGVHGECVD